MTIDVIPTRDEFFYALGVGTTRQTENLEAGRRDAYGFDGKNGLFLHRFGTLCEYFTTKGLDVPFRETKLGEADIGYDIQVRGASRNHYSLIVHDTDKDPDHHRFILTTYEIGSRLFVIRGWLYGHECKKSQFWKTSTGRPAFFVPQRFLRQIETLAVEPGPRIELGCGELRRPPAAQRAG